MEENKKTYPKVSTLIKLYCIKKEIIDKCSSKISTVEPHYCLVKKAVLDKYKKCLKYNEISSYLQKHTNILNCIKEKNKIEYNKLNENDNITKIILNIKGGLVEKIEKTNLNAFLDDIKKEDSKEWEYKIAEDKKGNIIIKLTLNFLNYKMKKI